MEIIKLELKCGEDDFLDLEKKFTQPINSIDEFIEKSDLFLSDNIKISIAKLEETYIFCDRIYQVLEKHNTDIGEFQLNKLLHSYTWKHKLHVEKKNQEKKLENKQPLFEEELIKESKLLVEEIDELDNKIELMKKMSDFKKSYDNEEVF